MGAWTAEEIERVGAAVELQVASRREDGEWSSWRTIWVVREGDELYIRSAFGPGSDWFRSTRAHHEGRIRAGGVEKEVAFVDADPSVNGAVDKAYRSKYQGYAANILDQMTGAPAASTTMQLIAR